MQIKTIEKTIKSKLNEWLATISDEKLRSSVKENLLVSGGSIASMLMNEQVNDYDIYLMDLDVCKSLAEYYIKGFKDKDIEIFDGRNKAVLVDKLNLDYSRAAGDEEGIERNNSRAISLRNLKDDQIKLYFGGKSSVRVNEKVEKEKLNYVPVHFSPNAISLSNDIQIVLRFWGVPAKVHLTFDYVHATNYFTFKDGLVRNLAAMESIITKQLKYQGSHYPLTSIIRAKKFLKRGFNMGAGELLKIMFQIGGLNLEDPDVLEEQLIGVDVAYFDQIIKGLRNEYDKNPEFKIDSVWFNDLIDKIFNEDNDSE